MQKREESLDTQEIGIDGEDRDVVAAMLFEITLIYFFQSGGLPLGLDQK